MISTFSKPRIHSLSNPGNRLRRLASNGFSIGVSYTVAAESNESFPHIEIDIRRESLPSEESIRWIVEESRRQLIWHVRIDDIHQSKTFESVDWQLFIAMLEASDPERHIIILNYDRTSEYSSKHLDQIESFRDELSTIPIYLDTEHPSWKSPRIQSILKSLKLPHVFIDAPSLPGFVKDATYAVGATAIVRCVGRNKRTWFESTTDDRFAYSYSEEEILEIARRVIQLKDDFSRVIVTFCNRPGTAAIQNARELYKRID